MHYKIVGNIPYYITGHLLKMISELEAKPSLSVLMIQKEVAERICAVPKGMNPVRGRAPQGDRSAAFGRAASNGMNRLAASVQYWAKPSIVLELPPESFEPAPKVESAVIKLEARGKRLEASEKYYSLVRVLFQQPRKTVWNNLLAGLKKEGALTEERKGALTKALSAENISPTDRPETLSIEKIVNLSRIL